MPSPLTFLAACCPTAIVSRKWMGFANGGRGIGAWMSPRATSLFGTAASIQPRCRGYAPTLGPGSKAAIRSPRNKRKSHTSQPHISLRRPSGWEARAAGVASGDPDCRNCPIDAGVTTTAHKNDGEKRHGSVLALLHPPSRVRLGTRPGPQDLPCRRASRARGRRSSRAFFPSGRAGWTELRRHFIYLFGNDPGNHHHANVIFCNVRRRSLRRPISPAAQARSRPTGPVRDWKKTGDGPRLRNPRTPRPVSPSRVSPSSPPRERQ